MFCDECGFTDSLCARRLAVCSRPVLGSFKARVSIGARPALARVEPTVTDVATAHLRERSSLCGRVRGELWSVRPCRATVRQSGPLLDPKRADFYRNARCRAPAAS